MRILDLINQSKNKENYTKREYNKRECNEKFFENLDNEKSAYWAGFILSDGNLTKYIVRTELSIKDLGHLKKFQNDMESTHPIEITKRLNKFTNKEYEFCAIQFTRKKLVEDLTNHGITKNKSKFCTIPNSLSDGLIHHFLRGVFDGDGSFYITEPYSSPHFKISSPVQSFLIEYQNILMMKCNLNQTKLDLNPNKTCYSLVYNGNLQVKRITDYLYKNATVYLERKLDKIRKHFNE